MSAFQNQEEISDSKFDSLTRSYVRNPQNYGVFETMCLDNSHGVHFKERHLARLLRGIRSIQAESIVFAKLELNTISEFFEADINFFKSQSYYDRLTSTVLRYQIILDEKNPNKIIRMLKTRSGSIPSARKLKIKICKTPLPENEFIQGRKDIDRRVYDKAHKELSNNFFDGILSNKLGQVIEGIKTNIFSIKETTIYTPSLCLGGVAGIMRQIIIERAQDAGLNVIIAPMHYLELMQMDAVFLTNSIIGVAKVDFILRPDRVRSVNVFKPDSRGFKNLLATNILKNNPHSKRIKS